MISGVVRLFAQVVVTKEIQYLISERLSVISAVCGGCRMRFWQARKKSSLMSNGRLKRFMPTLKLSLRKKRYQTAIALFEEVERQHPYSAWARRAMLMKAFAYYRGNDYDEALEAINQFISLHPGNKDAAYAYYLKAMCFYERIRDVGRDQEYTNDAVTALNDVIRRYPNSEYARDAQAET